MLWDNAAESRNIDLEERFEVIGQMREEECVLDAYDWSDGTIMWCSGVLEAMTLAEYERATGHSSVFLWDLGTGPEWPDGYAVLSSRAYSALLLR